MQSIKSFYSDYSEESRLVIKRARQIEFLTTMKYIKELIKPNFVIADIGAGAGVYALEVAKYSKKVIAIDIVPEHINKIQNKVKVECISNIDSVVGNALNIDMLKDSTIDIVLCLGPYYHLQKDEDRMQCISECRRVLKKNGIAFFGYINRVSAMQYYVKNRMYFDKELYEKISFKSYENIENFDKFLDISFYSDPEMIESEVEKSGFKNLKNIGVDSISYFIQEQLEEMDNKQWEDYLQFHFDNCERKNSFGMSMHGLLICRRYDYK